MNLKFSQSQFWKHEDCSDTFITVRSAYYNVDNTVSIHAGLFNQKDESFGHVILEMTFRISPKDYKKWHPYKPIGDCTYVRL